MSVRFHSGMSMKQCAGFEDELGDGGGARVVAGAGELSGSGLPAGCECTQPGAAGGAFGHVVARRGRCGGEPHQVGAFVGQGHHRLRKATSSLFNERVDRALKGYIRTSWRVLWVQDDWSPDRMSRGLRPWAERLAEQELASGTVVGDAVFLSPEYRVDPGLSRYTRSFAFRAHPFETRRNYATDLTLWLEFLWRRSKGWREATSRDLDDFEFWRRLAPQNPVRVGGSKWNRERAAITGLYRWAVREGLVRVSPTAGRQAAGRARDARPSNVHWLTPRTWKLWADIGPAAALPTAGRCMAGRAGWRTATRCLSSCSPRRVCAGRWPRRC
ncbi:hypothetical protein SUDANB51_08062 [Streptomyces sp. enrichment culture]|uniref:site-specific integrase n=2 Tax=Streptomyces TaxID=1883 RepID=UPI003F56B443